MRYFSMLSLLAAGLLLASANPAAVAEEKRDDTKSFFNGKDLTGWEGLSQYWSVKDGAIVGFTPKDPGFNTFLCTKKKYRDFEMSFQVRLKNGIGNSGVQIRSEVFDPKKFRVRGPQ